MSALVDLRPGRALVCVRGLGAFEADEWQLGDGRVTAVGRWRRPDGRRAVTTWASWATALVTEIRPLLPGGTARAA